MTRNPQDQHRVDVRLSIETDADPDTVMMNVVTAVNEFDGLAVVEASSARIPDDPFADLPGTERPAR